MCVHFQNTHPHLSEAHTQPTGGMGGEVAPVALSFYTFQSMAYTIDVYRGRTQPTKSFLNFE